MICLEGNVSGALVAAIHVADIVSYRNMFTSQLTSFVPILDGSNWMVWQEQMTSYLKFAGLWGYVQGKPACPTHPGLSTTPTANQLAAVAAAAWDLEDDKCLGAITLQLASSCRTHVLLNVDGIGNCFWETRSRDHLC